MNEKTNARDSRSYGELNGRHKDGIFEEDYAADYEVRPCVLLLGGK